MLSSYFVFSIQSLRMEGLNLRFIKYMTMVVMSSCQM